MFKELTAGSAAASVLLRDDRPLWADGKNEARFSDVRLVGEYSIIGIIPLVWVQRCGRCGHVAIHPDVVRLAASTGDG